MIKQGYLYQADTTPFGSRSIQTVLVVSNDQVNRISSTVIVIPVSHATHDPAKSTHIRLPEGEFNHKSNVLLVDHIWCLEKNQIHEEVGPVHPAILAKVKRILDGIFTIEQETHDK